MQFYDNVCLLPCFLPAIIPIADVLLFCRCPFIFQMSFSQFVWCWVRDVFFLKALGALGRESCKILGAHTDWAQRNADEAARVLSKRAIL